MNDFYDKHKKALHVCFFLFIAFNLTFPLVFNTPYPLANIVISNDWIGFWGSLIGSIIGGFVTLIGVVWSINHNSEMIKKQQTEQYRPILDVEILTESEIIKEGIEYTLINDSYLENCKQGVHKSKCQSCEFNASPYTCSSNNTSINMRLTNVGRGIAKRVAKNITTTLRDYTDELIDFQLMKIDESYNIQLVLKLPPYHELNSTKENLLQYEIEYEDFSGNTFTTVILFSYDYESHNYTEDEQRFYEYTLNYFGVVHRD